MRLCLSSFENEIVFGALEKIIEELQKGMATATKNWKIIAILDEVKFDQAKFLAHPELTKVLDSAEIAKVSKASNFQL